MPKAKQPSEKLSPTDADKARDDVLRKMLKSPPRPHKSEPRRATVTKTKARPSE